MPHRVIAIFALMFAAAWLAATGGASAQDVVMEAPPAMDNGAAPMTHYGGGSYFSQDLGTVLRLRYSTESYGQSGRGNFDIGTMQVWSLDGSAAFFDGQVTLNELQGVGYNFGLGYRALSNPAISRGAGRMNGVSLWTDGTSTDSGNFFPQIGLSLESLGDMWDFRSNGYLPLGPDSQIGEFAPTGVTGFQGFSISELTQAVVNTSYAVADLEAARRLGSERDAWAFAGPYFVGNDDDDAVGYRVGVRGYAYPDLLLQLAVTDDDIFKTNATFSVTWFVGRTRTDFQPACGVPDRMREPVLRNDYVALSQSFVNGGIPLTQPDGSALRIVHVNGNTTTPGDGSFENPLADQQLDEVQDFSQEGDIILAWAESEFDLVQSSIQLQDNQRLLGEGRGVEHTVATQQEGVIIIPETSPGARDGDRPAMFNPAPGSDAIILANANEVNNFDIDGTGVGGDPDTNSAIVSPPDGSGNPVLRNLLITDMAVDGITLTPLEVVDSDDVDNDGNTTETFIRGNVTIANVDFANIGADDIDIDSATIDVTLPNVTLQEVISITGVTSIGNSGRSIAIANTHTGAGRTATINNFTYNGGASSLGGIVLTNFDSTFNASNSTLTGGNILGAGAQILGDSDGTMTFASTVVFNDLTGTAVDINGSDGVTDALGGTITVNGVITTMGTGRSVRVRNVTTPANIDFNGNITDNAGGILIGDTVVADGNSGGTITFATGTIDLDIATGNAVTVANNTGATIEFIGPVDIDATGAANGLVAFGGGTLRYSNTANSIDTVTGQVVRIQGMTIQSPNGVVVSDVNRTLAANTSAIQVENNTGGPIVLGNVADPAAGDSGTLQGGGADTVVINNSANVTLSAVIINNQAGFSGVHIDNTTAAAKTVNLNDLQINGGDRGVEVSGAAAAGALTMSFNDSLINDSTDIGLSIASLNGGTVNVTNLDVLNDSSAGDGVTLLNNSTTTNITFNNLDIDTTSGDGFTATSGGTLAVTGTTSTIDTVTGTGLILQDMPIAAAGVTFQSVNVDNGTNGIILRRLTGGSVAIGNAGGADGAGGTLTTSGTAIEVTDVQNSVFRNIEITNPTVGIFLNHTNAATATAMNLTIDGVDVNGATVQGLDVDAASSQDFNLRVDNSTFAEEVDILATNAGAFTLVFEDSSITTGNDDVGLALTFTDSFDDSDADVTIQRNTITTNNESALLLLADDATIKAINLLLDDNVFTNNSAVADNQTVRLLSEDGTTLNATIFDNTITNSNVAGTAEEFFIAAQDGGDVLLNLSGNTANSGGGTGNGNFTLLEEQAVGSTFSIFEKDATVAVGQTRNDGNIILDPNNPPNFPEFEDSPDPPPVP